MCAELGERPLRRFGCPSGRPPCLLAPATACRRRSWSSPCRAGALNFPTGDPVVDGTAAHADECARPPDRDGFPVGRHRFDRHTCHPDIATTRGGPARTGPLNLKISVWRHVPQPWLDQQKIYARQLGYRSGLARSHPCPLLCSELWGALLVRVFGDSPSDGVVQTTVQVAGSTTPPYI